MSSRIQLFYLVAFIALFGASYAAIDIIVFARQRCGALPRIIDVIYATRFVLLGALMMPICATSLLFLQRRHFELKWSRRWATPALLLCLSAALLIGYFALASVFDCGWGHPLSM